MSTGKARGIVIAVFVTIILGWLAFGQGGRLLKSHPANNKSALNVHQAAKTGVYSGWKTDRLIDERLSYRYPSNWVRTSGVQLNSPGSKVSGDSVTLTSPSNLMVTMQTGASTALNMNNVLASVPLSSMGSQVYLSFFNALTSSTGLAQGACLQTGLNSGVAYPASAYASKSGSGVGYNVICISYPEDESGKVMQNTISAFQADPFYPQALNIIKSLAYN
ncbi:MAG TPA: hypothetical protein VFN51_02735 [Candidatus Saccharimonadales bacterium]|nr:hypothetical protein [Candidatus Saccharimonadales bacterium]